MSDSQSSKVSSSISPKKPLGQILIEAGLISISQVELALREQKDSNLKLGEILVAHGWIKQKTIDFFCERWLNLVQQEKKKPLIYYFREAGLLNAKECQSIVQLQKLKHKKVRFHRLAVEQGYLKRATVDFFLAHIFNVYDPRSISVAKPYEILKNYSQGQRDFHKHDLSKAPLMNVTLKGICLNGSNLRKADLSKANLSHSELIQVNLSLANLSNGILTETNFSRSFLTRANFRGAHLEKANFEYAILHEVDFTAAYLGWTNFAGADLTKARLPLDYPYEVYYDEHTIFDCDFDPQAMKWTKTSSYESNLK